VATTSYVSPPQLWKTHAALRRLHAEEMIRKEVSALVRSFSLDYWLEKDRKGEYPVEFRR